MRGGLLHAERAPKKPKTYHVPIAIEDAGFGMARTKISHDRGSVWAEPRAYLPGLL